VKLENPIRLPGAPAPPEDSCPVCDMVRKHEPGCPFEGMSMKEANREYRDYEGPS
jgi:hypothetical protein